MAERTELPVDCVCHGSRALPGERSSDPGVHPIMSSHGTSPSQDPVLSPHPVASTPNDLSPPAAMPSPSSSEAALQRSFFGWLLDYLRFKSFVERGRAWAILAFLGLAFAGLRAVVVPMAASRALNVIAEGYDIEMEVGDWNAGLVDFSASAEDVVIRVPKRTWAQAELLEIDELELDLSLWSGLRGKGWINEVTIREPKLYLERLPSGLWNWHELGSLGSASQTSTRSKSDNGRGRDSSAENMLYAADRSSSRSNSLAELEGSAFNLSRVRIEDMTLEWVENLPANSGGGLIQNLRASLFFDDMEISAQDLMGLLDPRPQPTRVSIDARTADGKISMSGNANFFSWGQAPPSEAKSGSATTRHVWSPTLEIRMYLENVGAGAFSRLSPEVAIYPARGTMSGEVNLALNHFDFQCAANVEVRDVTFAVNRSSPLLARRGDQVEREVSQLRPVNGQYQFDCGGLGTAADFRPVHAFQSRVVRESLRDAPKLVQAAAVADHARYSSQPIEPEYRGTLASMLIGVDPKIVGWIDVAAAEARKKKGLLDRLGISRVLPGRR